MRPRTYLAASAFGALAVANGHRPLVRSGIGGIPAFALGWFDSELPMARAGLQLGLTAAAARSGSLRSPPGLVAAALTAASVGGSLHLRRLGRRSAAVLEAALVDELGSAYRERVVWAPTAGADAPVERRRVPLSLTRERRRYVGMPGRNVAYGDAGKRNTLDVWRRADLPADGKAPVLIQVHGGAWVMGDKNTQAVPLLSHLAARGWVCVSTMYRLAPRATWPDLIADVFKAVAWTKANISRFGGDPGFVAVTGGSAGGHLSALAALASGDPDFQPGFESADTSIQAAVPLYGVYDWLDRSGTNHEQIIPWIEQMIIKRSPVEARDVFDRASPVGRIHAGAPPFFVLHGVNDSLVKVEQAREFASELRKVSAAPVVYAELPGAQHAFDLVRSPRAVNTVLAIERFLGVAYGDHLRRGPEVGNIPPRV